MKVRRSRWGSDARMAVDSLSSKSVPRRFALPVEGLDMAAQHTISHESAHFKSSCLAKPRT